MTEHDYPYNNRLQPNRHLMHYIPRNKHTDARTWLTVCTMPLMSEILFSATKPHQILGPANISLRTVCAQWLNITSLNCKHGFHCIGALCYV